MKNVTKFVIAACIVMFFTGNAWALPSAYTYVTMEDDWDVPYTMTDADGNEYATFCLEKENYFTPGTSYYVDSVGEYAIGGGEGADEDGRDAVSEETKWLYAAYVSGVFDDLGGDAAVMVQYAIWLLEDELEGGEETMATGYWETLSGYQFDDSAWTVVAVNMVTKSGGTIVDVQSQLVGAPVPEPATMLLLGTGLFGLAGVGRKKLRV